MIIQKKKRIGRTLFKVGYMNGIMPKKEENRSYSDDVFYHMIELADKVNTMTELLSVYNETYLMCNKLEKLLESMKNKVKVKLRELGTDNYFDDNTKLSASITITKKTIWDMEKIILLLPLDKIDKLKKEISYEKFIFTNPERREQLSKILKKNSVTKFRTNIEGEDNDV